MRVCALVSVCALSLIFVLFGVDCQSPGNIFEKLRLIPAMNQGIPFLFVHQSVYPSNTVYQRPTTPPAQE